MNFKDNLKPEIVTPPFKTAKFLSDINSSQLELHKEWIFWPRLSNSVQIFMSRSMVDSVILTTLRRLL